MDKLLQIVALLRDPERGCPWDKAQDYRSIAPHTLEEAHEVVDAIERDDFDELRDELGDLLFQVVLYSRMAEEQGRFTFSDISRAIEEKLIRRHPHVFAGLQVTDSAAISKNWEDIKAEERSGKPHASGVLGGIPLALPALSRAQKLGKRAGRIGFDWDESVFVLDKVYEELAEVEQEIAAGSNPARLEDEVGDLLFSVTQLARHLKLDAEAALRRAGAKFERRFTSMEKILIAQGIALSPDHRAAMEATWMQVKAQEKSSQ